MLGGATAFRACITPTQTQGGGGCPEGTALGEKALGRNHPEASEAREGVPWQTLTDNSALWNDLEVKCSDRVMRQSRAHREIAGRWLAEPDREDGTMC